MTDQDLLHLLGRNPEQGLNAIMDTYMGLVYTIVRGKLSNSATSEDVEEVVSDAFCELYQQRRQINLQRGSLKAYLATIAKRKAIDRFRRLQGDNLHTVKLADLPQEPASPESSEAAFSRKETAKLLLQEIEALGPPDDEIFIRKYYLGQSTRTIAQALHMKENTIDQRVSRGMGKLRHALGGVL